MPKEDKNSVLYIKAFEGRVWEKAKKGGKRGRTKGRERNRERKKKKKMTGW